MPHKVTSASTIFIFWSQHLLRLGGWLSGVVAEKVVKVSASAVASISSEPSIVAGIFGVGLFTWGTVNLCKESSYCKKAEEG